MTASTCLTWDEDQCGSWSSHLPPRVWCWWGGDRGRAAWGWLSIVGLDQTNQPAASGWSQTGGVGQGGAILRPAQVRGQFDSNSSSFSRCRMRFIMYLCKNILSINPLNLLSWGQIFVISDTRRSWSDRLQQLRSTYRGNFSRLFLIISRFNLILWQLLRKQIAGRESWHSSWDAGELFWAAYEKKPAVKVSNGLRTLRCDSWGTSRIYGFADGIRDF